MQKEGWGSLRVLPVYSAHPRRSSRFSRVLSRYFLFILYVENSIPSAEVLLAIFVSRFSIVPRRRRNSLVHNLPSRNGSALRNRKLSAIEAANPADDTSNRYPFLVHPRNRQFRTAIARRSSSCSERENASFSNTHTDNAAIPSIGFISFTNDRDRLETEAAAIASRETLEFSAHLGHVQPLLFRATRRIVNGSVMTLIRPIRRWKYSQRWLDRRVEASMVDQRGLFSVRIIANAWWFVKWRDF